MKSISNPKNLRSGNSAKLSDEEFQKVWDRARLEYIRYQQDRDTKIKDLVEHRTRQMMENNTPIEEIVAYGIDQGIYKKMNKKIHLMIPILVANMPTILCAAKKAEENADNIAQGAENIRQAFQQLIEVATAIAEPILWFYALGACIMMATGKNKQLGWDRLKTVGYAYVVIALLPTCFAFLRWIATLIQSSANF